VASIHVRHRVQRIVKLVCSGRVDGLLSFHSGLHYGMVLRKLLQVRKILRAARGLVLQNETEMIIARKFERKVAVG
jgi:hypothetical protein